MKEKEIHVETKPSEIKKKGRNPVVKFFSSVIFIAVLVLCSVGATLGYAYRDDIKTESCSTKVGSFFLDEALNVADCSQELEESQNEFSIKTTDGSAEALSADSVDVSAIYELANPSVVGVGILDSLQNKDNEIIGTGFVVSEDGLIATNQHVVSITDAEYFVKFPDSDEVVEVSEVFRDEVNDIAILKVNKTDLPSLVIGDSDLLKPGEPVIAIGNPLGELNSTVTYGIVSGLHREVGINNGSFLRTSVATYEDTIQTDAAINPGNSGGPLLNAKGEVIGINFATIATADNLSFAIPTTYLITRLNELNEFGRFRIAYIGIEYQNELVEFEGKSYVGARVMGLDSEGSAEGLLEIDDIIIAINDQELEGSSVAALIQRQEVGDFIDIDVIRNRRIVTETVEVIERD